jgi:hypothetical protein
MPREQTTFQRQQAEIGFMIIILLYLTI